MAEFQNKLSELEKSQSELAAENTSLKDLCVYLNEQREQFVAGDMAGLTVSRDSGDGSSGSSPSVDKLGSTVNHVSIMCPSVSLNCLEAKSQWPTKGTITNCFYLLEFLI